MTKSADELLELLPCVLDFPKPGILYRDISPLIANPKAFQFVISRFVEMSEDQSFTHILAIDSRGFIFGSALAYHLELPLILARKPNKLPLASHRASYLLEYGQDELEIQQNHIGPQSKVIVVDDVLASGGTLMAASSLVKQVGAEVVGTLTLLEIKALNGRQKLNDAGIVARSILSV